MQGIFGKNMDVAKISEGGNLIIIMLIYEVLLHS